MTAPVGLFGLGLMGKALAGRLQAAGAVILGHDPDPDRRAAFAAMGGTVATPPEIWAASDCVILCVFNTAQVEAVLATAPDHSQACVIITSTCDPDRIAALPARCPERMQLVDAPVSGTSAEVAAGTAVFLAGGEEAAIARAAPLLESLERALHHVGPLGHGSRTKLAINLILGLNRAALAEGLVFAEQLGLAPATVLQVARDTAAASAVMATKGPLMVSGTFVPQGRIAQSAKDFDLILRSARAKGQDLPFARTYLHMMDNCVAAGEAELDNAAIISALRRALVSPSSLDLSDMAQTSRHRRIME
jgi:3-hydroxyisobutyrate dehydrogenase-like beta-hydroxyacid dehydrogenase